jgi:hypothetical protein
MWIGSVKSAVVRIRGSFSTGIVGDEHGHKLPVGISRRSVVIVILTSHEGDGGSGNEKEHDLIQYLFHNLLF